MQQLRQKEEAWSSARRAAPHGAAHTYQNSTASTRHAGSSSNGSQTDRTASSSHGSSHPDPSCSGGETGSGSGGSNVGLKSPGEGETGSGSGDSLSGEPGDMSRQSSSGNEPGSDEIMSRQSSSVTNVAKDEPMKVKMTSFAGPQEQGMENWEAGLNVHQTANVNALAQSIASAMTNHAVVMQLLQQEKDAHKLLHQMAAGRMAAAAAFSGQLPGSPAAEATLAAIAAGRMQEHAGTTPWAASLEMPLPESRLPWLPGVPTMSQLPQSNINASFPNWPPIAMHGSMPATIQPRMASATSWSQHVPDTLGDCSAKNRKPRRGPCGGEVLSARDASSGYEQNQSECPQKTLPNNLRELGNIEAERILVARKINRLGFDSAKSLEVHFAKYGNVERVLVAHSNGKNSRDGKHRLRKSGFGFVVMSSAAAAQASLAAGSEQLVLGGPEAQAVVIQVLPFSHSPSETKTLGHTY